MNEKTQTLGQKISVLRGRKGYSIEQLAYCCGSSKSYIWSVEKGKFPRPSGDKIALIAKALDTTPNFLLGVGDDIASAEDEAFFNRYLAAEDTVKEQIRAILRVLTK
jgi:transcriptional regulator with XRE-family HTH domain